MSVENNLLFNIDTDDVSIQYQIAHKTLTKGLIN